MRRMIPLMPILMVGLLILAGFNIYNHQKESREEQQETRDRTQAFCETELHTRQVIARTLTIISTDDNAEPDSESDNQRERRLADRIERELRVLPETCYDYVDPSTINIRVE